MEHDSAIPAATAPESGLGRVIHKGLHGRFHYEPTLTRQFLPGCGNCGHKHPLAMKPIPVDREHCSKCGASVAGPAEEIEEEAVLTGYHPVTLAGRFLLWLGKVCHLLSMRLEP